VYFSARENVELVSAHVELYVRTDKFHVRTCSVIYFNGNVLCAVPYTIDISCMHLI